MDYRYLAEKLTELAGATLDAKDQLAEGVSVERIDHDRWLNRYRGEPWASTQMLQIENNIFHAQVSSMVGNMLSIIGEAELTEKERFKAKQQRQLMALMASQELPQSLLDTLSSLPPST